MQFHGVTREQLNDVADIHNMRAIDAYPRTEQHGWVGACLRPVGQYYRRRSIHGRRVNAVCWCGHRRFLLELFARYPNATVKTTMPRPYTITADTLTDWLSLSAETMVGSMMYPAYPRDLCDHD